MPMERTCDDCGKVFAAKTRRARFCSDLCRVRANRRPSKVGKARASREAKVAPLKPRPAGELEGRLRSSLSELNALDTISGAIAVRVAAQIDKGDDSGSAVATLSKELSRLVEAAKAEAAPLNRDKADDIVSAVNEKILRLVR